jgi:glycosyltransferase involved in cell wall biosynthesis
MNTQFARSQTGPSAPRSVGRPTITAAIIALNEERNLPGLLQRLAWADEVVVVDGGSTDATRDIVRYHGYRLAERSFDTFARQRNHALDLATGDWVLSIDADERPAAGLAQEIRTAIARGSADGYRVPIRSRIFGRSVRRSGTQDDCPVRLFRRGRAWWTGSVHEVLQVMGRVGRLNVWLEHDTLPDLRAFLAKMERYTTLEAHARVAAGRAPRRWDCWWAPPREIGRRLLWKQGLLDGPAGWAFSLLSGLSEWVLAQKHRRLWEARHG